MQRELLLPLSYAPIYPLLLAPSSNAPRRTCRSLVAKIMSTSTPQAAGESFYSTERPCTCCHGTVRSPLPHQQVHGGDEGLPPQLDEDRLHGVVALPLGQARQLLGVDGAVARVDAGQVDLADELDDRGLVGVLGAAVHLDAVDAVLVDGLTPSMN